MHTNRFRTWLFAVVAALALSACQTTPPTDISAPAVDPACTVSQAAFNHIHARHCTPGVPANQLLPVYCQNAATAQTFCRMVQDAPNKIRVVQPDGRIRYDSNLNQVVGTAGEKCGRMVMEPNGDVVTEFPETGNAPPPCL